MAKAYYLENTRSGRRFKVINIDLEAGTITLKGDLAEFTETWDKAKFKEMGYKRIEVDEPDDEAVDAAEADAAE